jgi:hypothetical protein
MKSNGATTCAIFSRYSQASGLVSQRKQVHEQTRNYRFEISTAGQEPYQ